MSIFNILTFLVVVFSLISIYLVFKFLLNNYRRKLRLNLVMSEFKKDVQTHKKENENAFTKKKKTKKRVIKWYAKIPFFGDIYKALVIFNLQYLVVPALFIPFILGFLVDPIVPLNVLPAQITIPFNSLVSAFFTGKVFMFLAQRHANKLSDDIPVFLDAVERGLRVGKPFSQVIGDVGDELNKPMRAIVRDVKNSIDIGMNPADVFIEYGDSTGVESFYFIAALLSANASSGGSMAPAFESLSNTVRLNKELNIKIEALSTETKFAGYMLAGMPFGFIIFISSSTPRMVENLWDTAAGNFVFMSTTLSIYISLLIMQRLSRIKT